MPKVLKESPLKKRRAQVYRRRLLIVCIGVALLIVGISFLFRLNSVMIDTVTVVGAKSVDEDEVVKIANDTLDGSYLFLFPKRNNLLYPRQKIQKQIMTLIPRISDLTVKQDKKTLTITITERSGQYVWCGEAPLLKESDEECYFLDDASFIFAKAPYFSPGVFFKIYGKKNTGTSILGTKLFTDEYLKNILSLKKNLDSIGLSATGFQFTDSGDDIMYLDTRGASSSPELLVRKDEDFDIAFNNLQLLLQNIAVKKEFQEKYSTLKYINLRFGNKIYYKF